MKIKACILPALILGGSLGAEPSLPPAPGILSEAELRVAAAEVPVARAGFVLPVGEMAAEKALAEQFFNQPEARRYDVLTTDDWKRKQRLFADALVSNAKAQGLNAQGLEACLITLGALMQNDSRPIIPVGAYLAQYAGGDCWIVVCKWELALRDSAPVRLGHVMVWAFDARSAAKVGYATCM